MTWRIFGIWEIAWFILCVGISFFIRMTVEDSNFFTILATMGIGWIVFMVVRLGVFALNGFLEEV